MNFVSAAKVAKITEYSDNIREYELVFDKLRKYDAGTFLQLTLDQVSPSAVWPDSRTFSIASYGQDTVHLVIQKVGYYTGRIFDELHVGSQCTVKYPFGDLFDKRTADENHVCIAGGLGVTPYLGLLDFFQSVDKLSHVSLLYSAKFEADFLYKDRIESCLKERAKFFVTREHSAEFPNRRIQIDDIISLSDQYLDSHYYICGSKDFNLTYKQSLEERGCRNIHMDEWD